MQVNHHHQYSVSLLGKFYASQISATQCHFILKYNVNCITNPSVYNNRRLQTVQ